MNCIKINGPAKLKGEVIISGSKNTFLPVVASSIVIDGDVLISNVPSISDVGTMKEILSHAGTKVTDVSDCGILINNSNINGTLGNPQISRGAIDMRASLLLLSSIIHRLGRVFMPFPGGCHLGGRGIDLHLMGLTILGADTMITEDGIKVELTKKPRLEGATIDFPKVSVGATQSMVIAGSIAKGTTIINNAAMEPEIVDLATFLNTCGAKINGAGTSTIVIEGVDKLNSGHYILPPDRIESSTYGLASIATGGDVELIGVMEKQTHTEIMRAIGGEVTQTSNGLRVMCGGSGILPVNVSTNPFPGFPTDLHSPLAAVLCFANGSSSIQENVHAYRFGHVEELVKMGANIKIDGDTSTIIPVKSLNGAVVASSDLRAGKALVIGGLMASGQTVISNIRHLKRGYHNLVQKLHSLGADITEEQIIVPTEECITQKTIAEKLSSGISELKRGAENNSDKKRDKDERKQ